MSQLALDLLSGWPPTLANFVVGANVECVAALRALAAGDRRQRFIYLWGQSGSGRSHLARALADAVSQAQGPGSGRLIRPEDPADRFEFDERCLLYAVDDCDRLDDTRQQAVFKLFNRVRDAPGAAWIATGAQPPLGLAARDGLRDDLRSRLGWGLVFELAPLTDAEKALALARLAAERGVMLAADVVPYLLTHTSRDMRALMALFDRLDRYALERKRSITLPLLRDYLQADLTGGFGRNPADR